MKKSLGVLVFAVVFIGACENVFSPVFSNESSDDLSVLLAEAESKMNDMDYEGAYKIYQRILQSDPYNAVALEGVSTAYLYKNFSMEDLVDTITNMMSFESSTDSAGTNSFFYMVNQNKLYDVSSFVSSNLGLIVHGLSDGSIESNDITVGLNFVMFNTIYGAFWAWDTSEDGKIDTNDYITITEGLEVLTNTNILIQISQMTNHLMMGIREVDESLEVLSVVSQRVVSEQSIEIVNSFHDFALSLRDGLWDLYCSFTN